MRNQAEPVLDQVYGAIADPTRRAILATLARGEENVGSLAERFPISFNGVSKHVKVLERAGLVSRGRDAQRRPVRVEPKPLEQAAEWLERYHRKLERSFQRLDALLEEMKATEKRRGRARR